MATGLNELLNVFFHKSAGIVANKTSNTLRPYTPKIEAVGVNTQTQDHKHMQTVPSNLSMKYTQTLELHRDNTSTQTQLKQHFEAGTNTN